MCIFICQITPLFYTPCISNIWNMVKIYMKYELCKSKVARCEFVWIPSSQPLMYPATVQITFIFIDFRVYDFAFRVLNVFYFQTDFNLRFKRKRDVRLTCTRIWCILHRTLSLTWPRRLTSHIIAQIDLTSCFKNTSFEWNKTHQTLTDHISKCAKRGKREMCNFGSCKTHFEFLSQFRKVRNAFQCFVTQVQTRLPKSKCVWPMKINVICTVY